MMTRVIVLAVCLGFLLPGYLFAQLDRKDEVRQLMVGLESASQVQRVNSAKVISRSGLQDQDLYVKVANLLSAGYMQKYEKEHADEMSWMCKALAASGDPQYHTLLDEVATKSPSTKVKKYAKESSKLIETYSKKNIIINSTEGGDQSLSTEQNRLINMLRSDDIGLRRDAAKGIVRNHENDEKVFNAAATALSDMSKDFLSDERSANSVDTYNQNSFDTPKGPHLSSLQVDTMAWICKALATSGDKKYIDLLEHVHDNSPSQKLRSYASKSLKALILSSPEVKNVLKANTISLLPEEIRSGEFLIKGKSTMDSIRVNIGEPADVESPGRGYSYWGYYYDTEPKKLVLKFDDKGVLNDYMEKDI